MAIAYFESILQLDHDLATFVTQSRMDNPRLTFDIREPSLAAHQDNEWRQPLRYDLQEIPFELSTAQYLAEQGRLATTATH